MTTAEILERIPRLRILVAGDICLDRWCTYDPKHREPSRETGLDRIGVVSTDVTPGGGGTVANNLAALGAGHVAVLGIAGDDGDGFELARALSGRRIDATHLIRSSALQTFTYTKLINSTNRVEDLPRVDFIHSEPLAANLETQLLGRLRQIAPAFDAIVALDQCETPESGIVTSELRILLSEIARASPEKVVWADSRIRCEHFRGVTMKVNLQEAAAACQRLKIPTDYSRLRAALDAPRLFVTAGAEGVHIATPTGIEHVPTTRIDHPVDICGAGDSFSAGAVCALALGATAAEAARFGNLVASITVMKPGTGTASPAELLAASSCPTIDRFESAVPPEPNVPSPNAPATRRR
jgi:rfaE bifunctional protein kinase chain/domain